LKGCRVGSSWNQTWFFHGVPLKNPVGSRWLLHVQVRLAARAGQSVGGLFASKRVLGVGEEAGGRRQEGGGRRDL